MPEYEVQEKLDIKLTFLIVFTFFCTSISWSLYNQQVPISLLEYISSTSNGKFQKRSNYTCVNEKEKVLNSFKRN